MLFTSTRVALRFLSNNNALRNVAQATRVSSCRAPLSTTTVTHSKEQIEPIDMAYATYETSGSYSGEPPAPVIVVHGMLGSKGNWNSLCKSMLQRVEPKRTIIAVDTRNHGDSPHTNRHTYPHMAADIKKLMTVLSIPKVVLLGHSMGGRAVMLFALLHPQLVEKLLVVDIAPTTATKVRDSLSSMFSILGKVNMPHDTTMAKARKAIDTQLAYDIKDKNVRDFALTNLVERPDGSYGWRVNMTVLAKDFNEHITQIPTLDEGTQYAGPTLFVAGSLSSFVQDDDIEPIKKLFPAARVTHVEGAGHWVHSEKPTEFTKLAVDFFNEPLPVV